MMLGFALVSRYCSWVCFHATKRDKKGAQSR